MTAAQPLSADQTVRPEQRNAEGGEAIVWNRPQALAQGAVVSVEAPAPSSVDLSGAAMAAKFAERLTLAAHSGGEIQLLLDPARFTVTSVTISGHPDGNMSFAYQSGSSKDGSGATPDEEALRQRLEARGLSVAKIEQRN
ncbi:hypothetical protein ABVV53_10020 [Novosphingobium sp. RD2P27]|uniref:Flagellar hook-length control protein FliK n=1 Tax=Novosphingobium kalidii TaxID=3230299 RepID=A0ABV2D260_9SPHN